MRDVGGCGVEIEGLNMCKHELSYRWRVLGIARPAAVWVQVGVDQAM